MAQQHPSRDEQFLEQIHQIIKEHLHDENFNAEELARHAGLSRATLHRRLTKLTGNSTRETITRQRIQRAMEFLKADAGTSSEIAYKVGFSDPSYFNKVFKKYYKISPGKVKTGKSGNLSSRPVITWSVMGTFLAMMIFFIVFKVGINREISIAILPLHNFTGNAENEYLIDGLHDALATEVGQIRSLRVISTTSTRVFKSSEALLSEIADQLGVNTILEGSVTEIGDSLKVNIQLVKVFPRESHLYAAEYQEATKNVLSIQKRIAMDIAGHAGVRLTSLEKSALQVSETVDPETYKSYLRGMFHINLGTAESIDKGLAILSDAIKRDPADPYALGAYALGKAIQGHGSNIAEEYFKSAIVSANRAITIDKNNSFAHTALALLYLYQFWNWDDARLAFEKALEVNPNNEIAHAHFAWFHTLYGNFDEAIYHGQQAVMLDPLSATFKSWLAWLYYCDRDFKQAEYWARESIELSGEIPWGNLVLGWTELEKGNIEKALEAHEKLPMQAVHWRWFLCRTYMMTGNSEKAEEIFLEISKESDNPFYTGLMAGVLGNHDLSFQLLREACKEKYYPAEFLLSFPSSESIIQDPRIDNLLTSMDLPIRKRGESLAVKTIQ